SLICVVEIFETYALRFMAPMRKLHVPRIEVAEPITTIVETTKSTFDVPFIPWIANGKADAAPTIAAIVIDIQINCIPEERAKLASLEARSVSKIFEDTSENTFNTIPFWTATMCAERASRGLAIW
ncbi:MAG: hypothetical protein ACK53G_07380, partial [Armatimonadota bacterium]